MCEGGKNKNSNKKYDILEKKNQGHIGQFRNVLSLTLFFFSLTHFTLHLKAFSLFWDFASISEQENHSATFKSI